VQTLQEDLTHVMGRCLLVDQKWASKLIQVGVRHCRTVIRVFPDIPVVEGNAGPRRKWVSWGSVHRCH
jgi:hypothetical protein